MAFLRSSFVAMVLAITLAGCARDDSSVQAHLPARPDLSAHPAALAFAITQTESDLRQDPRDSAARLKLGQLYHANGFHTEARACFESVTADPKWGARACYHLADIAQFIGDTAGQLRWLEEAIRLDPGYAPARLLLADARYKSGDPEAAVAGYQAVLQGDPGNPDALVGLARERLRTGDEPGAAALLEDLIEKHPKFSTGLSLLAQIVERRGDPIRAAVLREQARLRKDPPPVDPWMDDLMRSCFDLQQLGIRFEDFVKSGRGDEALACLKQVESIDPAHWMVCWIRGLAAEQQGRPDDAVREYERALAANGDAATIYPAIIANLVARQRFPEAESRARAGLRVMPDSPTLLVALADVRLKQRDPAEARELLTQALARDSENMHAKRLLSRISWDAGDREHAVVYLESIRKESPSDVPARALLGQYFLEKDDPAQAVSPLGEAHAVDRANADIADMLALAHLRVGNQSANTDDPAAALKSYDAAIAVRPTMAEAHANKVQLLLHLQRYDQAEEAMKHLASLRPENAAVHASLGDIQNAAGKIAAARASWQKAVQLLGPTSSDPLRDALDRRLAETVSR